VPLLPFPGPLEDEFPLRSTSFPGGPALVLDVVLRACARPEDVREVAPATLSAVPVPEPEEDVRLRNEPCRDEEWLPFESSRTGLLVGGAAVDDDGVTGGRESSSSAPAAPRARALLAEEAEAAGGSRVAVEPTLLFASLRTIWDIRSIGNPEVSSSSELEDEAGASNIRELLESPRCLVDPG